MENTLKVINELMVSIFNDILTIEQRSLRDGRFNDITITEVHTVEAIGLYEPKSMSEVAKTLEITLGTLTTAVNKLVKKNYVVRSGIENDRRVVNIALTKKGRLLYRIHASFHTQMVRAAVEGLDETEQEVLSRALAKVNQFFIDVYLKQEEK